MQEVPTDFATACLYIRDKAGKMPLMLYFEGSDGSADSPPYRALDTYSALDTKAARCAVDFNLSGIPDKKLLELLCNRDKLGRTCLWLLFKHAKPGTGSHKALAVAKMEWLWERLGINQIRCGACPISCSIQQHGLDALDRLQHASLRSVQSILHVHTRALTLCHAGHWTPGLAVYPAACVQSCCPDASFLRSLWGHAVPACTPPI